LATASCDLWQNEQRNISSEPVLFFTRSYSLISHRSSVGHNFAEDPGGTDRRGKPIIPSLRLVDDIVDDSVFFCLLRVHDEVPLHIFFYLIELLSAVLSQ
jgi:hypothetical protein